jgi:hypothetical protein
VKNKLLVFVSVFSVLSCPRLITAKQYLTQEERKGADLIVQKKDGQQVQGELITVKPSSLLLLDAQTGADVSVELGDLKSIKIIKRSKAWQLGILGFGLGALYGVIAIQGEAEAPGETFSCTVLCGALSAIPTVLIGAFLGKDKTIEISGKSDTEIKGILRKLRHQARVTDAQ